MIEIFLLSLIQGITEFIPVSSSSHLILFSNYTNFEEQSLLVDVSLHIGSFLAVLCYFYKDILDFVKNKILFLKILISSIPVMLIGFFLVETNLIENLRNIKVIAWTTLIFGIILYFSDKCDLSKNIESNFSFKSAIFIGTFQILSLIPGVSRSGITLSAARILNFNRFDSAKISFLLSLPTLGAVSLFGLNNTLSSNNMNFSITNILCIILSFLFSILTIKYFLNFVRKFRLKIFVIYRVLLGVILLFLSYL